MAHRSWRRWTPVVLGGLLLAACGTTSSPGGDRGEGGDGGTVGQGGAAGAGGQAGDRGSAGVGGSAGHGGEAGAGGQGLPPSLPATDFSKAEEGTPLEDFGYTVADDGGGSPAFVLVDEVIESDTGDLAGWFDFSTPAFEIDRTEDGGVVAAWDIRYPETVASGDHERSKFYVKLTDLDGEILYRFLFKPYLSRAQGAFNLEIAAGPDESSLLQTRSRDVDPSSTPTGDDAPWIRFEFRLTDDGQLVLLIDDVEYMRTTDDTYTVFNGVTFTYRTNADDKNYTIQVRDLSVLPID